MNKRRKIFVVSDIHGFGSVLKEELDKEGFEPDNPEHLLVCCGDIFDRGTENLMSLRYIELLENKVILRGNHEDMLLEIFDNGRLEEHNLWNGTKETIMELFGKHAVDDLGFIDFSGKTRMLDRVTEFIGETRDYFETENYVFVHGWLPTVKRGGTEQIYSKWRDATKESWAKARWTRWTNMYNGSAPLPNKTVICGHVPTFNAVKFDVERGHACADIFYGNGLIAVDAGTFTTGKINVLVIEDNLL